MKDEVGKAKDWKKCEMLLGEKVFGENCSQMNKVSKKKKNLQRQIESTCQPHSSMVVRVSATVSLHIHMLVACEHALTSWK